MAITPTIVSTIQPTIMGTIVSDDSTPNESDGDLLLEDGTSFILLENGADKLIME